MEEQHKKTVLRMIPYGLYVLTCEKGEDVATATISWMTQTSFSPPLVTIGVKEGSGVHSLIKEQKSYAISILGKDNADAAYAFFKSTEREGDKLNGQQVFTGSLGHPVLTKAPAYLECKLVEFIETGDHSIVVGEVVNAGVQGELPGRPDDATLKLKDLGAKVHYGG
ncbi:MAG: flavin reductase [Calditrichaeota bacterium]|nr:MAG: flavin reductase [Calditrichota bacterium]